MFSADCKYGHFRLNAPFIPNFVYLSIGILLNESTSSVNLTPSVNQYPRVRLTPSMRRPVDVKAYFAFFFSVSLLPFSQAASVAILPSALFCERYSLGARWVFSFQ